MKGEKKKFEGHVALIFFKVYVDVAINMTVYVAKNNILFWPLAM